MKIHHSSRDIGRSGKVVVLVAVLLPTVLIPMLALGVDGAQLMEDKRRLQAAVDAAALAGATRLWQDNSSHNLVSVPPPNILGARTAALSNLEMHGFTTDQCHVRTVNIPAIGSSNPRVNLKPGTCEVIVTYL